jgi:hypothetical protein
MCGDRLHWQVRSKAPEGFSSVTAAGYAGCPSTLMTRGWMRPACAITSKATGQKSMGAGEKLSLQRRRNMAREGNPWCCRLSRWPYINSSTARQPESRSRRPTTNGSDSAFRTVSAGSPLTHTVAPTARWSSDRPWGHAPPFFPPDGSSDRRRDTTDGCVFCLCRRAQRLRQRDCRSIPYCSTRFVILVSASRPGGNLKHSAEFSGSGDALLQAQSREPRLTHTTQQLSIVAIATAQGFYDLHSAPHA